MTTKKKSATKAKAAAKKKKAVKAPAVKPQAKKAAAKAPAKKVAKKTAAKGSVPANKAAAKPAAKKKASPATAKPAVKKSAAVKAPAKAAASKPTPTKATPAKSSAKPKKSDSKVKMAFSTSDYVVYPTHGVGKITGVEEQEISGMKLELFVIDFAQDKMTLRVPVGKAKTSGMRRLSTVKEMDQALTTLKGRARVKRTMWSRRAQEYEAKINSGDPISIAEVVRDLHRSSNQPDQSYSERQIYEAALGRLARELAAVEKTDEDSATEKLEGVLQAA